MAVIASSNPDFNFSEALRQKIIEQNREWDGFGMSPLTSPVTSPPSSLPPSRCSSPTHVDTLPQMPSPASVLVSMPQLQPSVPLTRSSSPSDSSSIAPSKRDRKEKHKLSKRTARQRLRAENASASFGVYHVRKRVVERYVKDTAVLSTPLATENLKVDSKGFIGIDNVRRSKKVYTLEDLVGPNSLNFELIEWDGKTPHSITDSNDRLIGVLAGIPTDDEEDWPAMCTEAVKALESRRSRCVLPKDKKKRKNRRGPFFALQCGVSHGGGQKEPKNLSNAPENQVVLEELNDLRPFKRVAGFASSVMAGQAPLLYEYYADRLGRLFADDKRLKKNFPSTIFAAATYNFGPRTVCYEHTDPGNLCFGWCSVTPYGLFDYTKGGHLILWDCRLVIQFPLGSTILLPSAVVAHSNTAIQPDETRYSFALYTARALFRWVENGFRSSVDYYASLGEKEKESVEAMNVARWKFGLSLLPIIETKGRIVNTKK